ncbi:dienelactone hydrolase family protein [Solibacillus sp. A46]|uniref:Dienelactone hydrolase family protein n=1 Tax=Solibacillus faecavium TaxID=2762221 RepID=A0ABR8XZ41_9BACL|nr:dienelactone hydrolase family protein [Solibacillus faecavium]MBD8037204.1 dienelactone hydrolase family protein [Solibacillus faecavium]
MNTPFTYLHKAPVMNTEKKPAIFLLHGLGSDENDLLQLVNSFSTQCHIFSLQGPIQHRPGYAFYTFEEEGKPNRTIFDKVLKGIEAFIKEAVQEYNLDEQQLYVVGFNQGAALAQSLAMVMGDTIRGTAALSGYLPEFAALEYSKKTMDGSKIFISHGEYDYDYPFEWAEHAVRFFNDYGTKVTFKSYPVGHGVSEQNIHDLIAFLSEDLPNNLN